MDAVDFVRSPFHTIRTSLTIMNNGDSDLPMQDVQLTYSDGVRRILAQVTCTCEGEDCDAALIIVPAGGSLLCSDNSRVHDEAAHTVFLVQAVAHVGPEDAPDRCSSHASEASVFVLRL